MRVLVCGGRDFANFPGHHPAAEALRVKYEQEHKVLVKTLDEFCKTHGLVTPSDEYGNWLPANIHIIAGGAPGADTDAVDWAVCAWVPFTEYKADWTKYGRSAGPKRNQQMIDEGKPDYGIAFPGGQGTADMVRRLKAHHIPVLEIFVRSL